MEKHTAYFNLLDQAKKPGCPVCAQVAASVRAHLDTYLYESVTAEETWDKLVACKGYCARHSRELESFSDGLAVSLFYRHLLRLDLKALKPGPPEAPGALSKLFGHKGKAAPVGLCPGCEHELEMERQQTRLMALALEEPEFWAAWHARSAQPGDGLCLEHLRSVLAQAGPRGGEFWALERSRFEALALELDEYVRKSDHECKEKMGQEGDAWRRVLQSYRGRRG